MTMALITFTQITVYTCKTDSSFSSCPLLAVHEEIVSDYHFYIFTHHSYSMRHVEFIRGDLNNAKVDQTNDYHKDTVSDIGFKSLWQCCSLIMTQPRFVKLKDFIQGQGWIKNTRFEKRKNKETSLLCLSKRIYKKVQYSASKYQHKILLKRCM